MFYFLVNLWKDYSIPVTAWKTCVLHRLLFGRAGPAVLRQTKESINPFDERVCHSVTTSTERLRSNLTAKGLTCTQDNRLYCMCVWDGVNSCVFVCVCVSLLVVCVRFRVGARARSHLTTVWHWQQMFTRYFTHKPHCVFVSVGEFAWPLLWALSCRHFGKVKSF